MKKIWVIALVLFLILAYTLNNLDEIKLSINPQNGGFDEIVLSAFQEENFDSLTITNGNYESRNTEKKELIDRVLENLNKLEIKEVKIRPTKSKENELYLKNTKKFEHFTMYFNNTKNFESFIILTIEDNYVLILTNVMLKEVDKEKNIVKWVEKGENKYYKIINGNIDFNMIEDTFLQLDKMENRK